MLTKIFQMFKVTLEKAEEPEIKLPTSFGSLNKQESSRKTSTSALLPTPKPLTMWFTRWRWGGEGQTGNLGWAAGFRKGRGTRNQIANISCITEKAREFQKNICF